MVADTTMIDSNRPQSTRARLVVGTRGLLVRNLLEDDVVPVPYSRYLARYPWPRAANAHTLSSTAVISLLIEHIRMASRAVYSLILIVAWSCYGHSHCHCIERLHQVREPNTPSIAVYLSAG